MDGRLIFCKFLDKDGNPRGRDYTYRTSIEVQEGDYVEVEVARHSNGGGELKKVLVTKTDVQPEEIAGYEQFCDRIAEIKGVWKEDERE